MMAEYVIGANIFENLTTGMYQDSKVIYREYIQNSCDQIDKAERFGILKSRNSKAKIPDTGKGVVDIWLDPDKRYIAIEDNATGIKADEFQRILGNIADSDKVLGQDKGFRGIGRLCGLAYCKKLIFTSRWAGEDVVSIMICDALKMREMINEAYTNIQKHSAFDVLNSMIQFKTRVPIESDADHFFKVELIEINSENEELFGGKDDDNFSQLRDYLSFVAPVPYHADFIYRSEIYEQAKNLNMRIDEYDIRINGEQIFKKYKTHLKIGNGRDHVFGVGFHEFRAYDNTLLAWMWFGKTSFKAAIKEDEISRGLRLRKENIQIGDGGTLRDMFTREASKRGNSYFIGEVFAVSRELIPNSQRTYFNETPIRIDFEHKLRDYFDNTLYYIYREGSEISSSIKKINSYEEKASEFEKKIVEGGFLNVGEREHQQKELEAKKMEAEKAEKLLKRKKESGRSILTTEIIERIVEASTVQPEISPKKQQEKNKAPTNIKKDEQKEKPIVSRVKKKFLVDTMFPGYNSNERKLLSEKLEKIFAIINKATDKKTSEKIINKIKEELR